GVVTSEFVGVDEDAVVHQSVRTGSVKAQINYPRSLHDGHRAHGRSGGAADLQRQRDEEELRHTRGGELVEIEALDDVDAALDQQVDVDGHGGVGDLLERDGVGARGEDAAIA